MKNDKRALILEKLSSVQYKKRLDRAYHFEQVEGGGILKKIERLFTAPSIYIPYLFYAKAGLSRFFPATITLFWGRKIKIPLQDYDALILYMYGILRGSEQKLSKFFIKNLNSDDIFYDIGANRGFYTFLASELCKEVHTFEPMPELTDAIKKNVQEGEAIVVNSVALSDKDGSIDFFIMESTMLNTVNPSVAEHGVSKKITVPTVTIDKYLTSNAKPTFLKIDAEGAEEMIIKGGSHFFSSNSPVIAMEIWGKENDWELSMGAAERLVKMGYKTFRLDEEGELMDVKGDLSQLVFATGADNFIFKK